MTQESTIFILIFERQDGTTRILALWDQSISGGEKSFGRIPEGFAQGIEYTKAEIDAALAAGSRQAGLMLVPEEDLSGHGTEVLGIAAGNGQASGRKYRGVAPQAELIVVKLGTPEADGFPRTAEVMQAVEYVVRKAEELRRPVAVNLSFGNVYGSHLGNTLLETYLDQMANRWKSVFVTGMGNEAATDGHASGHLKENEGAKSIESQSESRKRHLQCSSGKTMRMRIGLRYTTPSTVRWDLLAGKQEQRSTVWQHGAAGLLWGTGALSGAAGDFSGMASCVRRAIFGKWHLENRTDTGKNCGWQI